MLTSPGQENIKKKKKNIPKVHTYSNFAHLGFYFVSKNIMKGTNTAQGSAGGMAEACPHLRKQLRFRIKDRQIEEQHGQFPGHTLLKRQRFLCQR